VLRQLHEANTKLRETNASNLERLEVKSSKIEELTSKLVNASLEIDGFRSSLAAKTDELLRARQIPREDLVLCGQLEEERASSSRLRNELGSAKTQIDKVRKDLRLCEESCHLMEQQNQQLTKDLQRANVEVGAAEAEKTRAIDEARAEFEKNRAEINQILSERIAEEQSKLAGNIKNLQQTKIEDQEKLAQLQDILSKRQEEIRTLQAENQASSSVHLHTSSELSRVKEELEMRQAIHTTEISETRAQITQIKAEMEKYQGLSAHLAAQSQAAKKLMASFVAEQNNHLNLQLAMKGYLIKEGLLRSESSLNDWASARLDESQETETMPNVQLSITNHLQKVISTTSEIKMGPPRCRKYVPRIPLVVESSAIVSTQPASFVDQHAAINAATTQRQNSRRYFGNDGETTLPDTQDSKFENSSHASKSSGKTLQSHSSPQITEHPKIQKKSQSRGKNMVQEFAKAASIMIGGSQPRGQLNMNCDTDFDKDKGILKKCQSTATAAPQHRPRIPSNAVPIKSNLKEISMFHDTKATSAPKNSLPNKPPQVTHDYSLASFRGACIGKPINSLADSKFAKKDNQYDIGVSPEKPNRPSGGLKRKMSKVQLTDDESFNTVNHAVYKRGKLLRS
jgi:hypothetical protein